MERDLGSFAGIESYVRGELRDAVEDAVRKRREVPFLGVVIDGREPSAPQPAVFGHLGAEQITRQEVAAIVKQTLRRKTCEMIAQGVIYIDLHERRLRVRLEHAEFGDHEWVANVLMKGDDGPGLGEVWGPKTPEEPTRLMPQRYMN